MLAMLFRRLTTSITSVVLLVTIVFFMIYATPGGPAYSILGVRASPAAVAALNHQMGLDHPVWQQYLTWWGHLFQGNLGYSFTQHVAVGTLLTTYLRNTLLLYAVATGLSLAVSLALGMVQGHRAERATGKAIDAAEIVLYSLPVFFIGVMLIYAFAVKLNWLPPGGIGRSEDTGGSVVANYARHMVLPAITLMLPLTAGLSRYFGHQVRNEYRQDYVRTAMSRGLSPLRIALNHVLRNAVRPLVTVVGMMIPYIFVGGVLTESVFNYPGLGWLLWRSALNQDYPTVTAIVLLIGVLTIVGNLAADMLNSILDVRVRYE